MTRGPAGYGRYNDDPGHVGCPRAKSDMTPCIARDGHLALASMDSAGGETCIGCVADPWTLIVEITFATKQKPGRRGGMAAIPGHADRLARLVREATELGREAG
jgi:hypothetical protein